MRQIIRKLPADFIILLQFFFDVIWFYECNGVVPPQRIASEKKFYIVFFIAHLFCDCHILCLHFSILLKFWCCVYEIRVCIETCWLSKYGTIKKQKWQIDSGFRFSRTATASEIIFQKNCVSKSLSTLCEKCQFYHRHNWLERETK